MKSRYRFGDLQLFDGCVRRVGNPGEFTAARYHGLIEVNLGLYMLLLTFPFSAGNMLFNVSNNAVLTKARWLWKEMSLVAGGNKLENPC